ncbi:glycine zipper 2TM domain-containing protein [Pseudorhodoferax sp. Leaf274]|uniref:glycine zipper 2TM domain-containing protein n=1 Tax=Pseudorhodoferax sp. Leaf274 TaxID=1736318 RepID=UPI0009EAFC60|nr:glycine zipper 2TM domain-containing protein [Pseudorhodoferax sp. Leaf274]
MKKLLLLTGASLLSATVLAQEYGTVISATPVMQQVAVPRLVCNNQQVVTASRPSGAGAVIGAIAGGVIGSAFGGGSGHAAATAIGALGGAVVGNQVEGQQPDQVQTVQNCSTQTFYQNQAAYYDVVYEYAGRRYQVQMANDPGPSVPLQVTPIGSVPPQQAPVRAPARIISSTTYVQPATAVYQTEPVTTVYESAPVYSTPSSSYVAPLAIGIGLGVIGANLSHRHYAPAPRYYGPPPRYYGPRPYWR